jgi:hypothetical protein
MPIVKEMRSPHTWSDRTIAGIGLLSVYFLLAIQVVGPLLSLSASTSRFIGGLVFLVGCCLCLVMPIRDFVRHRRSGL